MTVLTGVPIVRTGVRYQLASGERTLTAADLESIVDSVRDPHVREARIGIGHVDERFTPESDGDPAFGHVENVRLAESGNAVVGDMHLGPEWLTPGVVASAFPSRSIEARVDWTSPAGHRWPLVLTAVKLLGTRWPGISTLDDLRTAIADGGLVSASFDVSDVDRARLILAAHEQEEPMAFIDQLRQGLGLPADADEAAVLAEVTRLRTPTPPEEEAAPPVTPPAPPVAETPPAPVVEERVPVAASAPVTAPPTGTSLIDNETLAALRADAALGRSAHERQQRDDRDSVLMAAVADGRIPPSRRAHWETAWTADPEGTQTLVASLAPGLVPVDERGTALAASDGRTDSEPVDRVPSWMLPPTTNSNGDAR